MKLVKTICNMCLNRCGINVHVEEGEIVKVTPMQEHPSNDLCAKAYAIPELVHSPERLTDPLRKVDGTFKKISWDEAFEFIIAKLNDIKQKYRPESVVAYSGQPFDYSHTQRIFRRFIELYGSPNFATGSSLCYLARIIAHILTLGAHVLPHYAPGITKCLVLWGLNPTESHPLWADKIHAMIGRGAKFIVVDPKATSLAKCADIHAQIKPGTDCALALGLLNVIINEKLYDRPFVKEWTVGFDQLAEHVKGFTPKMVEEITWVKANTITNIARMYANIKPAAIAHGISLDHSTNGIQAIRAVTILMAITGNIDIPGGNIYTPPLRRNSFRLKGHTTDKLTIGADYPLFNRYVHEETIVPAIDAMLTEKPYPIKGLLIAGCNPVLTWPNSNKIRQGFEKLDLLLVVDIFMTETAKLADIVLPGTTFLEREDMRDYAGNLPLIALANKVIEPIGNSKEDWKIWAELGRRMGYEQYFPWKDTNELFNYWLEATSISLDQLSQCPGGIYYADRKFKKFLKDGFNTPSKRLELYSQTLKDYRHEPLPTFHEPAESPVSQPDLAKKFPLIFVSGLRTLPYTHSGYRNLPSLCRLVPEPLLEINPKTASSLGITDGDFVMVESLRGTIKVKAKFTEDVHPKIVTMQHGWSGANANCLTDDEKRDPISGYPGFRSALCRVAKT
ncbi:molybdopterin-dependent oxidoreductase [Chloroflexota bacterium]